MKASNNTFNNNTTIQNNINSQKPTNLQNDNSQPNTENSTQLNDELLKSFVGKNYEKIAKRPFNFAGFFFTTFYMFYRKMIGYSIILFFLILVTINIINNFAIMIIFNIIVGLFFNKLYLSYAKGCVKFYD